MGSNQAIKGKIVERKRCSNPNCRSRNLCDERVPTDNEPFGEKYCSDCFTTQTWGIFVADKKGELDLTPRKPDPEIVKEKEKELVPLTVKEKRNLTPAQQQKEYIDRWWEMLGVIKD